VPSTLPDVHFSGYVEHLAFSFDFYEFYTVMEKSKLLPDGDVTN